MQKKSVVIRDLHLIGIAVPPNETHAELIVDPNAVLAQSVTAQLLQPVAERNAQILSTSRLSGASPTFS
jgi:hypothetical protein